MNELDLAWAAGLFEGEGTVDIAHNRARPAQRRYVRLQLSSTDEDVVRRLHVIAGCGRVYGPYGPYTTQKLPYWMWSVKGVGARSFALVLLPHMMTRRATRMREVLAACP